MAHKFETAEIPFQMMDGRQVLTGLQMMQEPWLGDFVKKFPDCFEFPWDRDIAIYYPNGDAPKRG